MEGGDLSFWVNWGKLFPNYCILVEFVYVLPCFCIESYGWGEWFNCKLDKAKWIKRGWNESSTSCELPFCDNYWMMKILTPWMWSWIMWIMWSSLCALIVRKNDGTGDDYNVYVLSRCVIRPSLFHESFYDAKIFVS